VDRLEAAGLVERARTSEDRRVVLVKITAEGLEAIAPLDERLVEIHRRQMGHMTHKELDELSRLLVKAREPAGDGNSVTCDGNHHPRAANGKPSGKR